MCSMRVARIAIAVLAASGPAPIWALPAPAAPANGTSNRISYEPAFFAAGRPDTAYDMILLLPAFSFDPGGQARGYEASAGNVLVDGQRPSVKFETLTDLLKRIPASSVARIEVIRGGAAGIDMQGRTIVANVVRASAVTSLVSESEAIVTKDGHAGVGTQLEASRRKGASTLEGSINVYQHLGTPAGTATKLRTTNAGDFVSSSDARIVNPLRAIKVSGHAEFPKWRGTLRLNASGVIGTNLQVERDHVLDSSGLHDDLVRTDFSTKQGELSADYKRPLGSAVELDLVALQNFEKSKNIDHADQAAVLTDAAEHDLAGESILRSEMSWQASPKLTAQFSAEGSYNFLNGTSGLVIDGVTQPLPSADVHVAESRAQLFAQTTWKPSSKLLLEAGARLEVSRLTVSGDAHNRVSLFFPKPRLFLTWSPAEKDQIRFRAERTVSQLDFGQFVSSSSLEQGVINAGNEKLVPERDWIFESAWEHHLLGDGAVVLTLSHSLLGQVIDEVPIDGFSAPGNIGNGIRDQAELNVNIPLDRFGLRHARLTADGTWRQSRVTDPTTGERRRVSNDQPFSGTLSLTQDLPHLRSAWHLDVTSADRYDIFRIDEIQRFRDGASINVSWEYKPKPDLSVLFQIQNINDNSSTRERLIFAGLRNDGTVALIDNRDMKSGPRFYLRVRTSL